MQQGQKSTGQADTAPTGPTVMAIVAADSSGHVNFTAAATNAVSYDHDFGDGTAQTVASGAVNSIPQNLCCTSWLPVNS